MIEVKDGQDCTCFWSSDSVSWTPVDIQGIGSKDMTQWDRVSRPGVRYCGPDTGSAEFDRFILTTFP